MKCCLVQKAIHYVKSLKRIFTVYNYSSIFPTNHRYSLGDLSPSACDFLFMDCPTGCFLLWVGLFVPHLSCGQFKMSENGGPQVPMDFHPFPHQTGDGSKPWHLVNIKIAGK